MGWQRGGVAEVGWEIIANHGGGYSYRLCPAPQNGEEVVTEECFQQMPLKFHGDEQWVQYGYCGPRIPFLLVTILMEDGWKRSLTVSRMVLSSHHQHLVFLGMVRATLLLVSLSSCSPSWTRLRFLM